MKHSIARLIRRLWLTVCFCALIFCAPALAEELLPGALKAVALSDAVQSYSFTPSANGLYSVYLFSSEDLSAHAEISLDGEVLAQGDGALRLLSCRLNAGVGYTLSLSGAGRAELEIARETLSRSFDQPLDLTDDYSKLIARAGDVHWYRVSAEEAAAALFSAHPEEEGLALEAVLYTDSGAQAASSVALPSGAFALSAPLEANQSYRLRLRAVGDATGKYRLAVQRSDALAAAESIHLSSENLEIDGYASAELMVSLSGGDCPLMLLDSAHPQIAVPKPDGGVQGLRAGETLLTAYAYGGATASCAVVVREVPTERVEISLDAATMKVGDSQKLTVSLVPENASDRRLTFVTDDAGVVSVSPDGTLQAVGEGTAQIVAIAGGGLCTDMAYVAVEPAGRRYRALLVGEENYASTVDKARPGAQLSVESMASLFATADFDGETYEITTLMDAPRDEVIRGIRTAFADATSEDLSVVYLTCHGFYQGGATFFVMADGSVLAAADLALELRNVPGEILLLADCCGSGGLLGKSSSTDDLLDGVTSVFRGVTGESVHSSRIRVIASARLDQESYRLSLSSEGGMATVFARALCDAGGWNIARNAPGAMSADVDYNGEITFEELGRYMSRRVQWYLSLAGDYVQNVQYYPEGCEVIVLSK